MNRKQFGQVGENLACAYLVKKGFSILGRNIRITFGELDIIAQKKWYFFDKTIHFVEVKAIKDSSGDFLPEEKVDAKKQRKLANLCQMWLQQNAYSQTHPCQIDVIGILFDPAIGVKAIHYFPNAVQGY